MKIGDIKKLRMFGYDWKVTHEKAGGSFSFGTRVMNVPKDNCEPFNYLLHEIMEATMVQLYYRYEGVEAGQPYMFIMDHAGLTRVADVVAQIILDNKLSEFKT